VPPVDLLSRFEAQLAAAGFQVQQAGANPIVYRLVCGGERAGQVKVWHPLNAKFHEVRDRWRDIAKRCWDAAQQERAASGGDGRDHWLEVDRLMKLLAPYRHDFLDFIDLATAVVVALQVDGVPAPSIDALRYDFSAIERAIRQHKDND